MIRKAGLACIKSGKLLLVIKQGLDQLILPGGKPEGKENMKQALIRELKEELDIELNGIRQLGKFNDKAAGRNEKLEVTLFAAKIKGTPMPNSEIIRMEWVPADTKKPLSPILNNKIIPFLQQKKFLKFIPIAEKQIASLARKEKDWHFHILPKKCVLNSSGKEQLILEAGRIYKAKTKNPYKLGEKLVKLMFHENILKPKSSNVKGKLGKLTTLAKQLNSKNAAWHHHILLPNCGLKNNENWKILFEAQGKVEEYSSKKRPLAGISALEEQYYKRKRNQL